MQFCATKTSDKDFFLSKNEKTRLIIIWTFKGSRYAGLAKK